MTELWNRKVVVQLDDLSFEDLRVSFNVTKSVGGKPNKATISIYNVARDEISADRIRNRKLRVRLLAGYDVPSLLFEGNPINHGVSFHRQGADTIMKIQAQDGLRRYQNARVNVSFATETTAKQVVDEAVRQLGLPRGTIDIDEDVRWTNGVTLNGPVTDVLDRVARSLESDWSIQNGKLQILPRNGTRTRKGPKFSRDLGNLLEATPTKNGTKVVSLLTPNLSPGDRFELEDDYLGGIYKAVKVSHKGDTGYSSEFYTTAECRINETRIGEPKRASEPDGEAGGFYFTPEPLDSDLSVGPTND